jgi:hypothetical protein
MPANKPSASRRTELSPPPESVGPAVPGATEVSPEAETFGDGEGVGDGDASAVGVAVGAGVGVGVRAGADLLPS